MIKYLHIAPIISAFECISLFIDKIVCVYSYEEHIFTKEQCHLPTSKEESIKPSIDK